MKVIEIATKFLRYKKITYRFTKLDKKMYNYEIH